MTLLNLIKAKFLFSNTMKKIILHSLLTYFLLLSPVSAALAPLQNDSRATDTQVSLYDDASVSFLKDVEYDLVSTQADICKVEMLNGIAPQDFEQKKDITLQDLEDTSRHLLGGLSTILRVSINEEIEEAYLQGGEEALANLFIEEDFITKQTDGTYYCHRTQESHHDPIQLVQGAIHKDKALNRLIHHLIPTTNSHIHNIQNTSNRKKLQKAKKQAHGDIRQHSRSSYHWWKDRNVSNTEKELTEAEMKGLTKKYNHKINQAYRKKVPTKNISKRQKRDRPRRKQRTYQNPALQDDYHDLLKQAGKNKGYQQRRREVLRQQLKHEKLDTEIDRLGDPHACLYSGDSFPFAREAELQQEKIKNSQDLKNAKKDFQTDPLYQKILKKGVETQLEQEDIHRKKCDLLDPFGPPRDISDEEMKRRKQRRRENQQKRKQYDKEIKERGRRKHHLRKALLREDSPSGWQVAGALLKGGVKSGVDFVKLPLDMACLAGKLTKNTLKSAYYLRDEFGICNTVSGAKELIHHLCSDGKYDWESPEQYKQRLQVARTAQRRQQAYEKFYNAQDYHLGNAETVGYWTAEAALFIFGGEIIKGAGNVAKGFTKVHQVEEGAHLFRQGQKIQKAHQEAHLLEEGIKAGTKGLRVEEKFRKGQQGAHLFEEGVGMMEKGRKAGQKIKSSFSKNFPKKVRKHIDQVRKRYNSHIDKIPSPNKGGIETVKNIIKNRVAQGGGYRSSYASQPAFFYKDGNVVYVFKENGEFWTILKNTK